MIDLSKAAALCIPLVTSKSKHQDYERTLALAREYKAMMTGHDLDYLMRQFNRRESDDDFDQRKRITKHITPAIVETLMNPARKLQGVKPVVDKIDYGADNDVRAQELRNILADFNGGRDVDNYLGSLVEPSDADPNAFALLTFDNFDNRYDQPTTYPVLIGSQDVWDFQFFNQELQYLWIHRVIDYVNSEPDANGKTTTAKGCKFVMYVDDHHIVFTQVKENTVSGSIEEKYLDAQGVPIDVANGASVAFGTPYYFRTNASTLYEVTFYNQKSGQVPAFRIGCKPDALTDGRTLVNRWHAALPFLEKSLKQVSELDLTTALHVFAQKLQYVGKCRDPKCKGGYYPLQGDSCKCNTCHGSGFETIKSAQEAITLPLPTNPDDWKDLPDISKFISYVDLPIELVQQMRDIVKDNTASAIKAVFPSDTFVRSAVAKTATEANIDMQSVYDAEQPHAQWWGFVRVLIVHVVAAYNDRDSGLRVVYRKPRNLNYESVPELIAILVSTANAPIDPSIVAAFNMDLISHVYVDDPDAMKKQQTQARFNPYPGLKDDTVLGMIANGGAIERNALLWVERATIFGEAEAEYESKEVGFYDLDEAKQRKIISAIVDRLLKERQEEVAAKMPQLDMTLGTLDDGEGDSSADPDAKDVTQEEPAVISE